MQCDRRAIVLSAALLHDIGHRPFSHVFEKISGESHEKRTAEIILGDTEVSSVLVGFGIPHLPIRIAAHDHPLPSGCAFSLRIDGREQADMARRSRRSRRGAVVPRAKIRNSRESLSSPRRASLQTADRGPPSLSSLFVLPRARAAGVAAPARPSPRPRLSEGDGRVAAFLCEDAPDIEEPDGNGGGG